MKVLKILGWIIITIIVILVLIAGYFGFVPGVSSIFGSNKARDLGITTSQELFDSANNQIAVARIGDASIAEKVSYEGSHPADISFSSEEISSLIAKGTWKYNPIAESFQMKISPNGAVEISALLNRTRLDGYLKATGFAEALKYTGTFNVLPEKVPFYLNGSATIVNNKIDLNLTGAQIGRVPLPTDSKSVQTVKNFIERRISGISGLNVDSLNFTNGKLHFKGTFPSKMSF
jgi:hypothetical protein